MAPLGRVLLAVVESNLSSLHHVHQSSWRGHQQVAASLQVSDLLTNVRSTVHHTGAHSGPISKLQRATERLTVCLCGCLGSFRVPVHVSACIIPFWLHHISAVPVLWLGPVPARWGTAYGDRTFHSPVIQQHINNLQKLSVPESHVSNLALNALSTGRRLSELVGHSHSIYDYNIQ